MLYLLLSILTSTSLIVILRLYDKWKVNSSFGIVFNYFFCVITGLFFVDDFNLFSKIPSWNGFPYVLILGIAFILIFQIVGKATLISGVATTSIAMKLSFVIPAIFAVWLYGDSLSTIKICGIACAILSVFLISYEKSKTTDTENNTITNRRILYPFLIFVMCGLCDATFNHIQKKFIPAGWDHQVTITVFLIAAIVGIAMNAHKKELYQWKNVTAGIALGIPNYFSLYFLLKTLKTLPMESSTIFPINNLGIVCLSALSGYILFHEKFSRQKIAGIILAIASIIIIGFVH